MSEISFPIKDLTRRKFQTSLTILGLTICTSATLFLVVFGSNLGFEIAFLTVGGRLTSGFSTIFSRFILVIGLLNIVAGAFITSFLVYMTMSERVGDIGVMKAAGCLSGSIRGYFITELSILVFLSCIAGTIFGIGAYYISINLLNILGFSVSQVLSLWAVLLVFLILILVSHIFGALPIIEAAKVKPAEALSPLYSLGTTLELGKSVPSKLGFTFKVAYRNLARAARSQVLAEIKNELFGKNLEVVELNEILGKHVNFLNHIWSFVARAVFCHVFASLFVGNSNPLPPQLFDALYRGSAA